VRILALSQHYRRLSANANFLEGCDVNPEFNNEAWQRAAYQGAELRATRIAPSMGSIRVAG
jgi:hypothetical protein